MLKEILAGCRVKYFPVSMAENHNKLCRKVVETPSLQIHENQIDALKNQI